MFYNIACGFITAAGFTSGLAPNFGVLIVLRFIVGFGVGGLSVPFDLLAEFLPSSHRGSYLLYIELFWTFGSLFVGGVAWAALSARGWRFLAYMTAIPVTVSLGITLFLLPESPRWLLEKGRVHEAEEIIRTAAKRNGQVLEPFSLTPLSREDHSNSCNLYTSLLSVPHRWISIPLWITWMAFGFSYYGVILLVARLFTETSSPGACAFDYQAIFINAVSEVIGIVISALVIDRLGRTRSQALLYLISAVSALCIGLPLSYWLLTFVSVIARLSVFAASSVTWVATSELYPTKIRATGHSICTSMARIGAFFSPYLVEGRGVGIAAIGGALFAVNIFAVFSAIWLPETYGLFIYIFVY